jgi:hypothetical protein
MFLQILVTIGVLLFVLPNLYNSFKKKVLTPFALTLWFISWIAGLILIWFPHLIDTIGLSFGVGRSIDAFVYVAIVYLIYASFVQKLKMNEISKDITILNRRIALKDINSKEKKNA